MEEPKKKTNKVGLAILKRLSIYLCILLLIVFVFFICLDYMNISTLVKDGFSKRAEIIIEGEEDPSTLVKVFTKTFLDNDPKLFSSTYEDYTISSYSYSMDTQFSIIFPWQSEVTITAIERVPYIDGSLVETTESVTEEDGSVSIVTKSQTPPEWQDAKYSIRLTKEEEGWRIAEMTLLEKLEKDTIVQTTPSPSPSQTTTQAPAESPQTTGGAAQ